MSMDVVYYMFFHAHSSHCNHTSFHIQHHMCSILYVVVPVYIAEISPKKLRGRLMAFNFIALGSGLLVDAFSQC